MSEDNTIEKKRRISTEAVAKRLNVSSRTITRWAKNPNNDFPRPFVLGPRCHQYDLQEIREWEERTRLDPTKFAEVSSLA